MNQQTSERPTTPTPAFILSDKDESIKFARQGNTPAVSGDVIIKLEKGVDVLKSKVGETHQDVAVAIDAVGRAYSDNEDYDNALRHFDEALEMKKKTLPQHHPSIADTLRSVGDVSQKIGLIQESEAAYKAANAIYRNAFDDRSWVSDKSNKGDVKQQTDYDLHQMISTTLVHIGTIEYQRENFTEALQFYKEAQKEAKMSAIDAVVLDRHNSKKSEDSLVTEARIFISVIMNNIANTYAQLNDKPRAISVYNSALNLQMQEVGEDHHSVSCTLHNMGTMHYQAGELQLSLKCYKQVLKMRRLLLGNEHPSIADALMNIAIVHEKAGELDKAESALNATLRVVSQVFDKSNFRVGFVLDCLGALHTRNGCHFDALRCFSRALDIYEKSSLSDDHPLVVSTKKSIEYVRGLEKGRPVDGGVKSDESVYDFMTSFLTCGGSCFANKSMNNLKPTLVLV